MTSPYLPQPPRLDDTPATRWYIEIWKKLGKAGALLGTLRFGSEDNYSQFEDTGTLVMTGDAITWNDINFSAANLKPGLTPPTWANIVGGLYGYTFSPTIVEELHGCEEILHDYKEGTDISVHIHWSPTTTNTGNVVWGLEYAWVNVGDVSTSTTTVSVTQASTGVVGTHQIVGFPALSGTGKKIASYLCCRIFRDATNVADTYTGQAFVPQFGIHYQRDTLGSREMTAK